jgi:hypothetical protein
MRHDYDLPQDWATMSGEEKSKWLTQERCRRQAVRQGLEDKQLQKEKERVERKAEANPAFVKLEDYQ